MKHRVTLADLSKETGLSQATVSMILARRTDVSFSEKTVLLVRKAAREMGYAPASRKRMPLFSRRSIMVICPFILNHYYSSVMQTVQSEAAEMSCNVLVYATYNSQDEESRILKAISESDIGGIIFAMMPQSPRLLKKISRDIPVIAIADSDPAFSEEIVELHNYRAGALIAEHLAELGHQHVICVSTPLTTSVPARAKRYEGLADTWKKLCPDGSLRLFSSFASPAQLRCNIQLERYLGRQIMESLLEREPGSFSAIVAINDMFAYGVMDALASAGISIPDHYSLCGCDNDFPSGLCGVNLTSVEHFMAHNAKLAFHRLFRKMTGEEASIDPCDNKIIFPELIARASTGPCRPGFPLHSENIS